MKKRLQTMKKIAALAMFFAAMPSVNLESAESKIKRGRILRDAERVGGIIERPEEQRQREELQAASQAYEIALRKDIAAASGDAEQLKKQRKLLVAFKVCQDECYQATDAESSIRRATTILSTWCSGLGFKSYEDRLDPVRLNEHLHEIYEKYYERPNLPEQSQMFYGDRLFCQCMSRLAKEPDLRPLILANIKNRQVPACYKLA